MTTETVVKAHKVQTVKLTL